jgi:IMP dehydrogenase/GMP reductase
MKISTEEFYDYDDLVLKPIPSTVNSRDGVDISINVLDKFTLKFPVFASPMRAIVNADFCKLFSELGGIATLHRFYDTKDEWYLEAEKISEAKLFGLSIGMNDYHVAMDFLKFRPNVLLLDVANAYPQAVLEFCKTLRKLIDKESPSTLLMAGNVASYEGVENLYNVGVEIVRCGIGGGSLCSTRNKTAIAVPQLSAIMDCSRSDAFIVCDGGIRNSGDAVKAFVAGSDAIMIGGILAQTYESPSENTIYGMASRKLMDLRQTQVKSVEGIEKFIEKKMSLKDFVDEFSWGIKSAATYLNASNLQEMRNNGEFLKVGKGTLSLDKN